MKKKINVYLAGPLFSEAEIKERRLQAKLIRDYFKDNKEYELDLYNPVELNDTVKDLATKPNIFFYENDIDFIKKSHLMIVDIDNLDSGTLLELGYFVSMKENVNKDLKIIVYGTDWRTNIHRSQRMNKFLDGMIKTHCEYVTSTEELLKLVKEHY